MSPERELDPNKTLLSSSEKPADTKSSKNLKSTVKHDSDLIVEGDALQIPDANNVKDQSTPEQLAILNQAIIAASKSSSSGAESEQAWLIAKRKIERFKPLPWFLWRLSKSVFSKAPGSEEMNAGMLLGLRRLVFAAASDSVLGKGTKVNNLKIALDNLTPDTIAAVSVIHSVCKRLSSYPHESVWKALLDESISAAQMGYELGSCSKRLGRGRGMISGFALNVGLVILIATGDGQQSAEVLELLSAGKDLNQVGLQVYGCEPLHIAAVLLASCGCGPDAAAGLVQSQLDAEDMTDLKQSVSIWALSHKLLGLMSKAIPEQKCQEYLDLLKTDEGQRPELFTKVKKIIRQGHSWDWIS